MLLGEVLIYVPSIARFRLDYLQERIAAAARRLALWPGLELDMDAVDAVLGHAGVLALTSMAPTGGPSCWARLTPVARVYDLRDLRWSTLIADAFEALLHRGERLIRVIGPSPMEMGTVVDIILPEAPMWMELVDYSIRILTVSVFLSLLVAAILFLGLQRMIVRPLRLVTQELAAFRSRPEDATADAEPKRRDDEIGVVEQELAQMRSGLRSALAEKSRLAALGSAMSRIGHDLRNILATAVLISDRLEKSADPAVRRVAPRLVETLDRAVRLCGETLSYARSGPPAPSRAGSTWLSWRPRCATPWTAPRAMSPGSWRCRPSFRCWPIRTRCSGCCSTPPRTRWRRSATRPGTVRIAAELGPQQLTIDVADDGPGIPESIRDPAVRALRRLVEGRRQRAGPRHLPRADARPWRRYRTPGNWDAGYRISPSAAGTAGGARPAQQEATDAAGDRLAIGAGPVPPGHPAVTTRGRRWQVIPGCRIRSNGSTATTRSNRTPPAPSRGCGR